MKKKYVIVASALAFFPSVAKAHCPLCTAGAGFLAVGAAYLGVSSYIVGIMIGAFAMALSLWLPRMIKKKYIPYQKHILILLVFFSTIMPIMPLIQHYTSFNIYWFGEYGSMFNKTYMVSRFLIGSFIGAFIMLISPYVSKRLARLRDGKLIPYQGISITLIMLVAVSLVFQFAL